MEFHRGFFLILFLSVTIVIAVDPDAIDKPKDAPKDNSDKTKKIEKSDEGKIQEKDGDKSNVREKGKDELNVNKTPKLTIIKVCDVCLCKDDKVDCTNRHLNSTLSDHEWPTTSISLVDFSNNKIELIKPFPNATIAKLVFRNNTIKTIKQKAFELLVNFTELDLSQNLFTFENLMPQAFQGPYSYNAYEPLDLKVLNLSSNQLHTMNNDLFEHLPDLKTLILSNNPFEVFDSSSVIAFHDIPHLEELDMSHCPLETLDEAALISLRNLKKLDLSWNKFSKLPAALRQSRSLEQLVLDGNLIEMLGFNDTFPTLPNLKWLSMSSMPRLMTLERGALANLQALEVLIIENCKLLTEMDDDVLAKQPKEGSTTWPTLKTLNISNNALRYLPATFLVQWDKLEELHLMNNQWSCDCENQYLIGSLLPEHAKRLMSESEYSSLRCSAPPEHENRTLKTLAGRRLRCLDYYGARPERDAAILVGILVGVLLAIPAVIALFALWRRGFLFCGPQGPATFSRAFYRRASPYEDDV